MVNTDHNSLLIYLSQYAVSLQPEIVQGVPIELHLLITAIHAWFHHPFPSQICPGFVAGPQRRPANVGLNAWRSLRTCAFARYEVYMATSGYYEDKWISETNTNYYLIFCLDVSLTLPILGTKSLGKWWGNTSMAISKFGLWAWKIKCYLLSCRG